MIFTGLSLYVGFKIESLKSIMSLSCIRKYWNRFPEVYLALPLAASAPYMLGCTYICGGSGGWLRIKPTSPETFELTEMNFLFMVCILCLLTCYTSIGHGVAVDKCWLLNIYVHIMVCWIRENNNNIESISNNWIF